MSVRVAALILMVTAVSGRSFGECEFPDRDCGWNWSDGWNLETAQNLTLTGLGVTAPGADSQKNVKGLFLYWSADSSGRPDRLEIESPIFEAHTLDTCALQMSIHMYQMDQARFQVVIKAPNSTWESTRFSGSSAHEWETKIEKIGLLSQPFRIILEIINESPVSPSHVAVDNIEIIRCYERKKITTDCRARQFQCDDLICIEGSGVCDITPQCTKGEDEEQDCDKIPESAYCTFENGMCGWYSNETTTGKWILRRGEEATNSRTGPTVDHTYRNRTGRFLMAKFSPGRAFGNQATFTSPWFAPPPYYHRNVHSAYFNSCQIRFHFHKFGTNMGELLLYTLELDFNSPKPKLYDLWRSYGNKGDVWWNAVVSLPNMTNIYQIQFVATRGMGQSDISIDDLTLSPECFGIGVPENESIVPAAEFDASSDRSAPVILKYEFGTCGAKGRFGPNETMCSTAYQDSATKVAVMKEPPLEGVQRWVVPENGIYTVFVKGAGGGDGKMWRDNERSMGTFIRATFDWEAGEAIYILVGQKGSSVCDEQKPLCATGLSKEPGSKLDSLEVIKRLKPKDAGGGGGGATFLFTINPITQNRHPFVIAGGGGGLAAKLPNDMMMIASPHGLPPNASILPINGYTGSGAGGGGGWDDKTVVATGGWSLREGARGGESCNNIFDSDGGFGGGGGGCQSGGGGGGYRGGDAAEIDNPYHNGQGGTSFLHTGALRVLVQPGSNPGDGSVVILPAQEGCGCEFRCVYLDLNYMNSYCICPPPLTINMDGFSCNGHGGVSVSPKVLVTIIVSVVLLLSLSVICIFYGYSKYRKIHRVSRDVSDEPLNSPEEQLSRLRSNGGMISENNPNYEFGGNTCTEQDLKKVSREHLTLVKALGQGAFGEVYEGYLTNPADNTEQPVAVKTLPELSSSQAVLDFLMEALIMSKFNHPNIVSFIGVCFEKLPRFIVLELLPGGDLKSFLRECRPKPNKPSTLTVTDLLMLALDVAKGCQYLEENHFIHRDIAARNCLLTTKDANRVVKIADFGMARDIYRADYYRKGGKAMLPVKWMPPEAFLDGIFTSKTDVWSFGVLLWEVISLGYMPYPGRGNQEVMQLVTSGGRLEPPTNCPGPVYHVMMQCWHPHPDERPNFTTIIERLGYCLQDPDVINAPLPIFNRAPSMERDATVMRPVEDESGGCLQVQRPEPGLLLSPGSEDYLIPNLQSSYSLTTDLQSSPSQGSADQLLELEERSKSPQTRPAVWETNFINPDPPAERKPRGTSHPPMKRQDGYTEIPTEDTEAHLKDEEEDCLDKIQNGYVASGAAARKSAARMSSIKSLDDLPVAPKVGENENNLNNPDSTSSKHRSNLSLDPRALVRQMSGSEPTNLPPNRYVNVDVNCNTGDSNPSLSRSGLANRNSVTGPFDGYSGVNPVA